MKTLLQEINELAGEHGSFFKKVQDHLKKLDVDASISAIKDFFAKSDTPRSQHLIKQLKKLSYDADKGWIGNEGFFKEIGVSKEEFMHVAHALGEMIYFPVDEANVESAPDRMLKCPICRHDVESEDMEDHLADHDASEKRNAIKKMRKASPTVESTEVKEPSLKVRCPICQTVVSKDDLEDHIDEKHDKDKKPVVKKMKKER